jgi:hypothetical protein
MATVTRTGVKYIKVSKTDALGNNYDNSWRLNQSITLNYSDVGLTKYNVTTVAEYPSYWLLGLDYVNVTSSLQGAKNYKVEATKAIGDATYNGGQSASLANYAVSVNAQGFFDATTGVYGQGNAINIPLVVTASFYCDTFTANSYPFIRLILTDGSGNSFGEPPILEYVYTGGQVQENLQVTLTGTFVPEYYNYNGLFYQIEVGNSGSTANPITVGPTNTDFSLLITQSIAPASNTLTIPTPFFTSPFEGTDCDVAYGWVQSYPYSQYYMDIDYPDSTTIPVNQRALISGTAAPALVKDYYYQAKRHTLPRYEGSRASSLRYNEYTGPIADNINIGTPYGNYPARGYQGDSSYGKVASIDQYKSYAARFQYIAGYGPEMYNALLIYVTDIVDELGNVQQPKLDNPSYYNLINAFAQGEQATVKLLDAQGNTQFAGLNTTFDIIRAGKRIETPLYTYTGSQTYVSTPTPLLGISFEGTDNTPRFTNILYSSSIAWSGAPTSINTNFVALISASSVTQANPRFVNRDGYKLLPGDSSSYATLTFTLQNLQASIASGYYQGYENWVNVKFVSSSANPDVFPNNIAATYSVIQDFGDRRLNAGSGITTLDQIKAEQVAVQEGFYYYFIIAASSFGDYAPVLRSYEQKVTSDYPFNTAGASDVIYESGSYFVTSSTDRSQLSASANLTAFYGKTQTYNSSSGFNPPIPFTIEEGDQIRFGGNELYTHTIYNVQNIGSNIVFNVYPPLSDAEYNMPTVNAASIRRFTDDPNTIIVAGTKAAGGTPGGIIKPKYTTQALETVIDSNPLFTLQSAQSST